MDYVNKLRLRAIEERVDRELMRRRKEDMIEEINQFVEKCNNNVDNAHCRKILKEGGDYGITSRIKRIGYNGCSKHVLIPKICCEAVGIKENDIVTFKVYEGKLIMIVG